ncbi:hypothetical protein TcasGA2_TC005890 [Tribolium castaneum]|uniref:MADF domain-containing protein n=2 Tax=Tribolium castaneum TaxID=7070 RepID=D6WVQ7_TRICA|nr:PREDICTED: uncharacterized protein LOC100142168 [Tribolium castaneum]EFA08262.1 hypothetical protein TcasGA2_TC005890 [Tribolium castaneum]|eukprot:XP_001808109.1 PREDICTED: uncharacterized protein LOC100142168 [Tribolium castaneum]
MASRIRVTRTVIKRKASASRVMRNAEKIIEAVRDRPFLYDQAFQTFKHIGTKNRNWMEVAKIVYGREDKVTVNKVKIQWKSLRDAFVKQQRKRQSSPKRKLRPYIYESEMQFLLPHILLKERDEESSPPLSNVEVKTEDCSSLSLSGESPDAPPLAEESVWEQQQQQHNAKTTHHPVDAFFYGIAQTVKQLKPMTVAQIKKSVANIVMDAEISEIEEEGA